MGEFIDSKERLKNQASRKPGPGASPGNQVVGTNERWSRRSCFREQRGDVYTKASAGETTLE